MVHIEQSHELFIIYVGFAQTVRNVNGPLLVRLRCKAVVLLSLEKLNVVSFNPSHVGCFLVMDLIKQCELYVSDFFLDKFVP